VTRATVALVEEEGAEALFFMSIVRASSIEVWALTTEEGAVCRRSGEEEIDLLRTVSG